MTESSLAVQIADLPDDQREAFWESLSAEQQANLLYEWEFWARPEQLEPPGDWTFWVLLAGRGFGKTRTGAELVRRWSRTTERIALIAETSADARDVMVEGDGGILSVCPPDERPEYQPSKRRLTWPNGCMGTLYAGVDPDQLRGPQHEKAWVDELSKMKYPQETWDNMMMGLRLGAKPQVCVTMTPRPIPIVKMLVADPRAHLTRGSTFANLDNLAGTFRDEILTRYEGTRLGRQELHAEILDDVEGALWTHDLIEACRVTEHPDLERIVVGVDPPGSVNTECGVVVAGCARVRDKLHFYVLDDRSLLASPEGWGKEVVTAYNTRQADRVLGERNYGGDMVQSTIRNVDPDVSYRDVTATRGKQVRAEPIAALYEQKRVHHVGSFPEMEDEQCSWVPGAASPNRLDALVWALTELSERGSGIAAITKPSRRVPAF